MDGSRIDKKHDGGDLLSRIQNTSASHHVRILKSGAHMEIEINGHVTLQWDDPAKPLGAGRIGLAPWMRNSGELRQLQSLRKL